MNTAGAISLPVVYMADVIDSSSKLTPEGYKEFKGVVERINASHSDAIVSPLTITLGDEFQGIIQVEGGRAQNMIRSLDVVFEMEEQLLFAVPELSLRHVLFEGDIESPINQENAHGMIGEPLTQARERLAQLKSKGNMSSRFAVVLQDECMFSTQLERCFLLYEAIADRWKGDDAELLKHFLRTETVTAKNEPVNRYGLNDYKEVAQQLAKDRSLMWRRSKSLQVLEYQELKNLMEQMVFDHFRPC